jgi:hypothetical protein
MEYGVIFVTGNSTYNDELWKKVVEGNEHAIIWNGQNKGRRDHVVTNCDKEIHVMYRVHSRIGYTYYGTLNNESMHRMIQGDPDNNVPSSYFFRLNTDGQRLPFGHVCEAGRAQDNAVEALGFTYTPGMCGIYEVFEQ